MQLLAAATLLRLGLGEIDTAHGLAVEQLGLARANGYRRWEGDALTRTGMIAWTRGGLPAATVHLGQAVDALRAAQDRWRDAMGANLCGHRILEMNNRRSEIWIKCPRATRTRTPRKN
jgi:hypothetical protein